jgi:hypothetical protein
MGMRDLALGRGAHVCQFYETFGQQKGIILPFFKEGLTQGEHCLLIVDEDAVDNWCFELQAYGIDVKSNREWGALEVVPGARWRESEDFRSLPKAREVLSMLNRLNRQFTGVRIAGDASWSGKPAVAADKLCHWEATANLVFEGQNAQAICQYNTGIYPPSVIHAALRTHPTVLMGGRTYSNPYYEAPEILANEPHLNLSVASAAAVYGMLGSRERAY